MSVQDNFIPYNSYSTALEFARGTGFAERVSSTGGGVSPWLKEQATRGNDLTSAGKDLDALFSLKKDIF